MVWGFFFFFPKEVLNFPSPLAWYLCKSLTLSSTLSFEKVHSDTNIYISNQTLLGDGRTQCQARGEKRPALQVSKSLVKPQYLLLTLTVLTHVRSYCLLNLESFSSITFLIGREKLL